MPVYLCVPGFWFRLEPVLRPHAGLICSLALAGVVDFYSLQHFAPHAFRFGSSRAQVLSAESCSLGFFSS